MKVIEELRQLAKPHGIRVEDRGNGHVQLHGKKLVNYYPLSRRRTAYVKDTTTGRANVSATEAILMALTPDEAAQPTKRHTSQRRAKMRLLARTPCVGGAYRCWYCGRAFIPDLLTVEHLVPLSKGGGNSDDNKVLACQPCNSNRGNKMPHIPPKLKGRT